MSVGFGQILLILVLVFIVFGAGRLPSVMSDLAKGMRAFKKGMSEDDNSDDQSSKNNTTYVEYVEENSSQHPIKKP